MPLTVAKPVLEIECTNALREAMKETFIFGAGDYGDMIATRFANCAGPKLADAIFKFVMQAQVDPGQAVTGAAGSFPVTAATAVPGKLS